MQRNCLAAETSPNWLQHADNPARYAWGAGAPEHAKLENKPILPTLGYSARHRCHIIAHQLFADFATAPVASGITS